MFENVLLLNILNDLVDMPLFVTFVAIVVCSIVYLNHRDRFKEVSCVFFLVVLLTFILSGISTITNLPQLVIQTKTQQLKVQVIDSKVNNEIEPLIRKLDSVKK